ncbi:hypothetical protein [Quatrionicoccus australiensis]|uniref:hypothetical protein n=1 Tax=Quatrionicoccus australiensis TaxID=138118 RepID=UPI001CF897CB|nr:hypothetical protein [Quatrionicoccus australiensis]UCV14117.1 hypothetical protein KI612_14355 [Quatrionicoccus australiensis]
MPEDLIDSKTPRTIPGQNTYTPTAGEAGMLADYAARTKAQENTGQAGVLQSDTAGINAERTARWRQDDLIDQAQGASGRKQGIYQAAMSAPGPTQRVSPMTPILSETDQLNAERSARWRQDDLLDQGAGASRRKQGIYQAAISTPVQAFADGGKPEPGSMIRGAVSGKPGVSEQIRRSGLAHRHHLRAGGDKSPGGKIKGPGTPTSDTIPAQVRETGEPIAVSTDERILSKAQDDLLLRIAKALGFETVDALLESGTGKPVGPTIKGGKAAAATGMAPEQPGDAIKQAAGQVIDGVRYQATPTPASPLAMLAQGYGAVANKVLQITPNTEARLAANRSELDATGETTSPTVKQAPPAAAPAQPGDSIKEAAGEPIDNTPAHPLTTKDIVPGGYLDRGNGILAQRGKNGQLNVTNVGTEALTDPNKRAVDDSASALIDQKNSTYNPAAQLARMQSSRMVSDATDSTITDPSTKAEAVRGAQILQAARAGDAQAQAAGNHNQLGQQQVEQGKQLASLRSEMLDPATTPERRKAVQQAFAALSGREEKPAGLQAIDVEEPIDPKQPLLGNRKIPFVFDPRTGQSRPMLQQGQANPADIAAQAKSAISRGADPKAVNARLRAAGLPEVK